MRRNRRNAPSVARFSSPLRPCRSVSVFHGIISTVSKQLRYSHARKLCVPVGQSGLTVIYSRKISSEVKMQIPRCQVLQAQYLWHDLRFCGCLVCKDRCNSRPKGVNAIHKSSTNQSGFPPMAKCEAAPVKAVNAMINTLVPTAVLSS